ncbi:MAG: putative iron-regulated membrane protein [Planctomycetota bacterium]|jgi:uncharacterized iron-regulated membrane protein
MAFRTAKLNRKLHRIGAIVAALPLIVVIATGLLLQLKKDWTWVQPPTAHGTASVPSVSFDRILESASSVPQAQIGSWDDVDRLDVRPGKGVIKVRANNRWEVQLDGSTAEVLQVAYRRSDLIEGLHDGSWFHDNAKLWLFLPAGIVLLVLWFTGIYLWLLPYRIKRNRKLR